MANNDGLNANMNFWNERFEDVARVPLFEGSTLSSLSTTILILNCCQIHGVSNAFILELLALLKRNILPRPNALPRSEYEASCTPKKLKLAYKVINVCVNGFMLFWGAHANVD